MKNAGRLTRNEDLVLAALRADEAPQSAYQLLERVREDGIKAPLQVYRALRSLIDRHLVHRLESLNAFVACSHDHAERRHAVVFAICETCGRVDEFSDELLNERLTALAARENFAFSLAAVEVRGHCQTCTTALSSEADIKGAAVS